MNKKTKQLKLLAAMTGGWLIFIIAFVWLFDPFYQYHAPFWGLEAVLYDRDNQMPGTIRNFSYDSVLVGSSVAENFDSSYLDDTYGCNTLKVIRASGSMADLLYYLDMAQEDHVLKNVFWCLDLFALNTSSEVTLYDKDIPRYLYTKSWLDDFPYVFNKEVIFVKIPLMVVNALRGINTGGHAYDWSADKNFSAEGAMRFYSRPEEIIEPWEDQEMEGQVKTNLALLDRQIEEHPEIQYRFLIPPYSMLWWDSAYVNGMLEQDFYILEQTLPSLLKHPNTEVYYFQKEENIICDLDNYMDMIHYSPEINQFMLEHMAAGDNRITEDNWENIIGSMRQLADKITQKEIYRYYK